MIFILLTFLAALSLAAVSGWFSIVGFMAIYAGAPMYALIMGVVVEAAKLVTTSWLYRNSKTASWKIKGPLLYFTIALMTATSIGVFGFLSKAHLEQGAATIDNGPRIERLNQQIEREKSNIADNQKIITQLDATVDSFLGKDRTDRSLAVRKSQAPQRKQLREEIDASQRRIDDLSTEKMKYESEVRKMQLEVGPIRYIAELVYGVQEDSAKNVEAAVRMFTLLLVSTLDPLAIVLLIAANHSLALRKKEDESKIFEDEEDNVESREVHSESILVGVPTVAPTETIREEVPVVQTILWPDLIHEEEKNITLPSTQDYDSNGGDRTPGISEVSPETIMEDVLGTVVEENQDVHAMEENIDRREVSDTDEPEEDFILELKPSWELPVQEHPADVIEPKSTSPWAQQDSVLRELLGQHFVPVKVNVKENSKIPTNGSDMGRLPGNIGEDEQTEAEIHTETTREDQDFSQNPKRAVNSRLPLSWLQEFKRD